MLKMGETIKQLRKEQDITQEKLSAYLNISYQAISKWENGTGYPDITMIPKIANFFGVTSDELLGLSKKEQEKELKMYAKQFEDNNRQGKIFENITLCRTVLDKYPRNYEFMLNLAFSLHQYCGTREQEQYSKEHHFIEEVIVLCERILEDCTTDSIRHGAISLLCINYPVVGKKELAIKLANEMPDLHSCREILLSEIYDGEEKIKYYQQNLLNMIELCADSLVTMAFDREMGKSLSYEEKIKYIEASNALYQTILQTEDNALFFHCKFAWNYRRLAELWCALGNVQKAIENLLIAEKHACRYDVCLSGREEKYTSLFLNKCSFRTNNIYKNWEGTERSMLYYRTTESVFDILREEPEFLALQKRLQENNSLV